MFMWCAHLFNSIATNTRDTILAVIRNKGLRNYLPGLVFVFLNMLFHIKLKFLVRYYYYISSKEIEAWRIKILDEVLITYKWQSQE